MRLIGLKKRRKVGIFDNIARQTGCLGTRCYGLLRRWCSDQAPQSIQDKRNSNLRALLLLLPFVGLLWVPFFNMAEPGFLGFPFFYWYQLAWVPVSSLLTWYVWRGIKKDDAQ